MMVDVDRSNARGPHRHRYRRWHRDRSCLRQALRRPRCHSGNRRDQRPDGVNVEDIGRTEQSLTRVFNMQKIKRIEQTGDLVGMGLFLASPASNFMGQSVIVDGSMTYS